MRASFLPEIYLSIYLSIAARALGTTTTMREELLTRFEELSRVPLHDICRVADGTIATLNDHNRVVQCRNGSVCNTAYRAMVRVSAAQDELMRSVSDLRGLARQALSGKATAWCGLCAPAVIKCARLSNACGASKGGAVRSVFHSVRLRSCLCPWKGSPSVDFPRRRGVANST